MFAPDSIDLLQKSGLDFQRHEEMGIDPDEFAALLITSGLVLTDEAKWIGFHRWESMLYCFIMEIAHPEIADTTLVISSNC